MNQPTLHTTRLVLRPFTLADAKDIQRLVSDKEVAEPTSAIPHPYLDGMAESWIKAQRKAFVEHRQATFAIVTSGALIGAMSLMNISRAHQHGEIGYWIGRDFWNMGYATEAARAVADFGFSALGLNRIYGRCLKRNPASGRVMEKIGMQPEGCLREHEYKNDRFEDILLYGMLKKDIRPASEAAAS